MADGKEFLVDYKWDMPDKSPEAVYVPRVGVFIKAKDIHETRVFIPVRSIMGIRSLVTPAQDGKPVEGGKPDKLAVWIEEQFMGQRELAKSRQLDPII